MSRLRFHPYEWTTYFVTNRNLMGYSFMRPSPHTNKIIVGCLAYSRERYDGRILLHNAAYMSNHYHMLISAKDDRALSEFMGHFNGCLGKELGEIHDFHGKLWHKRYSASPVLDEWAIEDRYRYIFSNSVKEGLVEHPRDWPGFHAYRQLCEGEVTEGIWIDRTGFYRAKQKAKLKKNKGKPAPKEADFTRSLTLTLDGPPPLWGEMSTEAYQARCARLAEVVVTHYAQEREQANKGVLGAEAVMTQEVLQARFTKRSVVPLCHTMFTRLSCEFKEAYWAFLGTFKEASSHLRSRVAQSCCTPQVTFPEGGVPLSGGG